MPDRERERERKAERERERKGEGQRYLSKIYIDYHNLFISLFCLNVDRLKRITVVLLAVVSGILTSCYGNPEHEDHGK